MSFSRQRGCRILEIEYNVLLYKNKGAVHNYNYMGIKLLDIQILIVKFKHGGFEPFYIA